MAEAKIDVRDSDRQIWEQELADFVPMRVLDAHCHFFVRAHFRPDSPYIQKDKGRGMRADVDLRKLDEWAAALYPGRQMFYLILGTPLPGIIVEQHGGRLDVETEVGVGSCFTVRLPMHSREPMLTAVRASEVGS